MIRKIKNMSDIFDYNTIVPIPTQFNKNLKINYNEIKKHIKLLKAKNVNLFYLAQSASELERLSVSERIKLAKFVSKVVRPSAKLILQPLGFTSIEDQIFEAKILEKIGCDFIVVEPIHIKGKQHFYNKRFKNSEYSPVRHDEYYINYMKIFSKSVKVPILFHLKEFSFGKSLNIKALDKIFKNKNIVGLKEHNHSITLRKRHYLRYSKKKQKICYDGFSKEEFIITSKYGARARHSNFSWFDPEWDQIFIRLVKRNEKKLINEMIKIENTIKKVIILTGYAGYKYLMKKAKLTNLNGYVRMPGCNLDYQQKKILSQAYKKFSEKKINFIKNNNF